MSKNKDVESLIDIYKAATKVLLFTRGLNAEVAVIRDYKSVGWTKFKTKKQFRTSKFNLPTKISI